MFPPLDIPFEYWIEHVICGLLYVMFRFSSVFYRGVPSFVTDYPCSVWCCGLTTWLLHVGPLSVEIWFEIIVGFSFDMMENNLFIVFDYVLHLMPDIFVVRRAGLMRFWVVVICPIIKCLTVLDFSFILFDLCLFITIFNFILNYVLIITFWIFTYHKIWILLIIYCLIWNYWIIYFSICLEVFWSVVS